MKNRFTFYIALTIAILCACWCFQYAQWFRGYLAIGGEVFTLILPIWIVEKEITRLENKIKRMKKLLDERG